MLVGHLPHLGKLAALLMTGDKNRTVINFQMSSVAQLQWMAPGQWAVNWMILAANIL